MDKTRLAPLFSVAAVLLALIALGLVAVSGGGDGSQGAVGDTGSQGVTGPVGPAGVQGVMGMQGPQGVSGPGGPQGITGPVGPKGDTGVAGPQGQTGLTGIQGQEGPSGPSGSTGAVGATGLQGEAGPVGPEGPQGPRGEGGQGATLMPIAAMVLSDNQEPRGFTVTVYGSGFTYAPYLHLIDSDREWHSLGGTGLSTWGCFVLTFQIPYQAAQGLAVVLATSSDKATEILTVPLLIE